MVNLERPVFKQIAAATIKRQVLSAQRRIFKPIALIISLMYMYNKTV